MTVASNEVVASAYELFTMPYINKFDGPHPWEAFKAGYEAAEARAHSDPRPVAEGLREAERLIGYLFGTDRNTDGPRVVDLCFTAFMGRDKPNPEDGGKSDWFTDTKPNIDRCIAVMKDRLLAALATHSPAPMAGEGGAWTVWDAEARMAREGDWRGVAYSIAHDILPLIPEGSRDHSYQERARMQIKAADRLVAAYAAAHPSTQEGADRG